jgi:D-glycero-D-manno-heptose 1,7-bisphosphate phosphatase
MYHLIIFDADGTLRRCTVPGQVCPNADDQWELLPGVKEKLFSIRWGAPGRGRVAFSIASNQAGISKGYLTVDTAYRLLADTATAAVGFRPIEGSIRFCPHGKGEGCACRKPGALMLEQLMEFWGVEPEQTLFVGDMDSDRQAAENAGCEFKWAREFFDKTILGP